MARRRALLIGATEYGSGFAPLPAVSHDLDVVQRALARCGYDCSRLPDAPTRTATELLNQIEAFCTRCDRDDVHVVYFSGHGMLLAGEDCLVPAGAERDRVVRRHDLRVPTDLSAILPRDHGVIVFLIDACRSPEDSPITKAGGGWGDDHRIKAPADHRFVRFFGCSSGQLCHVLLNGHDGHPVSVFSKAFADAIADGATTLRECLTDSQRRCHELADAAHLEIQTPRLSVGEASAETERILGLPIFEHDPHAESGIWESFDPNHMHCLVVASERESKSPRAWTIEHLLAAAWGDTGRLPGHGLAVEAPNPRLWDAFRQCWHGGRLVSGAMRELPARFDPDHVHQAILPINRALESPGALREAVRAVVEADLAVFDITGFEPGVMMLLGIRAACRRGVTLCSHGHPWREGQPLELPFNVQDLSVGSHTPRLPGTGRNPVVERFVDRAVAGFEFLGRLPRYSDLPAYDALRQLGPDLAASSLINTSARVLVLCPFESTYFDSWELLVSGLSEALSRRHNIRPEIARVIDLASPQLVSQSIYQQARRTAACVADWSAYSPSVFVEFGVRQAVSEWGTVAILDRQFAERSEDPLARERAQLEQTAQLDMLFAPLAYSARQLDAFEAVAHAVVDRHPRFARGEPLSIVHDAAWRAVGSVERALPSVSDDLMAAADGFSHPDVTLGATQAAQVLFYESGVVRTNNDAAALERRIAAWLYLDTRAKVRDLPDDDPRKVAFRSLGRATAAALYDRGGDDDLDLALFIEDRIKD